MIVKNVSGITQTFAFSNRAAVTLANNAEAHLDDDWDIFQDALKYASQDILEIVKGPTHATNLQSVDQPAHIRIITTANYSDEETITINGVVFEFDDDVSVTAGNVLVDIGADAAESLDNLIAAVLAHASFDGYTMIGSSDFEAAGAVAAIGLPLGVEVGDVTVAEGASATTITVEELVDGQSFEVLAVSRTVATLPADLVFATPIQDIKYVSVEVRAAAGTVKAWDGATNWEGGLIALDQSGDTDIAATDTIFITAYGTR